MMQRLRRRIATGTRERSAKSKALELDSLKEVALNALRETISTVEDGENVRLRRMFAMPLGERHPPTLRIRLDLPPLNVEIV